MTDRQIVVLGAGVVGLTAALQLLRAGYTNVTVVAKQMPSDLDPGYASPWAGAIFVPMATDNTKEKQWEIDSWTELRKLAEADAEAAGIWFQDKSSFYREDTHPQDKSQDWWKDMVLDYHYLPKSALPDFVDWGIKYRTMALVPVVYLNYLRSQCLERGARFIQREVRHIRDAFTFLAEGDDPESPSKRADVVVNCTALGARFLGGVEDKNVIPHRGQLVLVENPSHGMFFMPFNDRLAMNKDIGETSYIIERPPLAGGGTALGGTRFAMPMTDPSQLSLEPDMRVAESIMNSAIQVCPALVPKDHGIEALRVIKHQVGYRPYREGGPRVELEELNESEFGNLKIIHNYGMGGSGYQLSYGAANRVVQIIGAVYQVVR